MTIIKLAGQWNFKIPISPPIYLKQGWYSFAKLEVLSSFMNGQLDFSFHLKQTKSLFLKLLSKHHESIFKISYILITISKHSKKGVCGGVHSYFKELCPVSDISPSLDTSFNSKSIKNS